MYRILTVFLCVLITNHNLSLSGEPDPLQPEHSFGIRQIEQMIEDRPDMAGVLDRTDPIFIWIAAGFSGQQIGDRIYWNEHCPLGMDGCNQGPWGGYPGFVTVSSNRAISPVDKWAVIIFELFNIQNYAAHEQLAKEAESGTIDLESFAIRSVKLEFLAERETNDFLRKNPLEHLPGRDLRYERLTRKMPREIPAQYGNYEYFRSMYRELKRTSSK